MGGGLWVRISGLEFKLVHPEPNLRFLQRKIHESSCCSASAAIQAWLVFCGGPLFPLYGSRGVLRFSLKSQFQTFRDPDTGIFDIPTAEQCNPYMS